MNEHVRFLWKSENHPFFIQHGPDRHTVNLYLSKLKQQQNLKYSYRHMAIIQFSMVTKIKKLYILFCSNPVRPSGFITPSPPFSCISTDSIYIGWSFPAWKVKPIRKCLKSAFFLMASQGMFSWFQRKDWLCVSLWENNPTSHLIYYLNKHFPNQCITCT